MCFIVAFDFSNFVRKGMYLTFTIILVFERRAFYVFAAFFFTIAEILCLERFISVGIIYCITTLPRVCVLTQKHSIILVDKVESAEVILGDNPIRTI